MQTNLQVFFLIENLFFIYTVSNLSSEVCLGPMNHASKACTEIHDLDAFFRRTVQRLHCQITKAFPFWWICITLVAIGSIYYSKRHKEWWAFRKSGYTPAQLKTKGYGAALRKVYENQVTGGKTENQALPNAGLVKYLELLDKFQ